MGIKFMKLISYSKFSKRNGVKNKSRIEIRLSLRTKRFCNPQRKHLIKTRVSCYALYMLVNDHLMNVA